MDAPAAEMKDKFELLNINSDETLACPAPQGHGDDMAVDPMQIDDDTYGAEPSSGSGAWEKPPTGTWDPARSGTSPDPAHMVSRRRHNKQKRNAFRNSQIRRPNSRPFNRASRNLNQLARVTILSQRLVGHDDPLNLFTENCLKTITDWVLLLGQTTMPDNLRSSDPRIIAAFEIVDRVIRGQDGTYLLRRLAYVQLMRMFTTLESIIRAERESGQVPREPFYRDATIAIDIYMQAQEDCSHPDDLRREVKERKRASRSWSSLSGPSPLFTMIYSDAAEAIVRDVERQDGAILKDVAVNIMERSDKAVQICTLLTDSAEWAVRSGCPVDMRPIAAAQMRKILH
ncbi:unnamed protein product [Clonostachys rhizophaga]|uniref:Uncharacterized protein n=1 Tax=Clonostachys rhizophaga TaxID=160324 RepID=A0A9N9YE56_9HYPO|nr:unnamed protein product [Clonostachys rhizophaga]